MITAKGERLLGQTHFLSENKSIWKHFKGNRNYFSPKSFEYNRELYFYTL